MQYKFSGANWNIEYKQTFYSFYNVQVKKHLKSLNSKIQLSNARPFQMERTLTPVSTKVFCRTQLLGGGGGGGGSDSAPPPSNSGMVRNRPVKF